MPRKEATHVVQDEEEASLLLVKSTPLIPISPPVSSSSPPAVDGDAEAPAGVSGGSSKEKISATPMETLLVATSTPPGGVRPHPDRAAPPSTPPVAARTTMGPNSLVCLIENKVLVYLSEKEKSRDMTSWVLDTGVTNHMSDARLAFAELNTEVRGTVSFGDGSVAAIEGYGRCCSIARTASIARSQRSTTFPASHPTSSIGQLDEAGYKVNIEDDVLRIREWSQKQLARVPRWSDRLYVLELDVARPVCLAARGKEDA
jgi:hypothetical protein